MMSVSSGGPGSVVNLGAVAGGGGDFPPFLGFKIFFSGSASPPFFWSGFVVLN